MSKHANPTAIGAFVVGAVVLIALAAALFGGSELLKERVVFVSYFEEQTLGLKVGSNVVANGVRVGFVSDIALLIDETTYETLTRVTMDILPDAYIPVREGRPITEMQSTLGYRELVEDAGLRAQLEIESFITGQLLVALDHRPDTPATLRGADSPYPEIPTIPSNIQEILDKIQNWAADIRDSVDLSELSQNLNKALGSIADLAASEDLSGTVKGINEFVNDDETRALVGNLNATLEDVRAAATEARRVLASTDGNVEDLSNEIRPVVASLNTTVNEFNTVLRQINRQLRGDSYEVSQFQSTMREVEAAAEAMRDFFDYIERNPEAILKGKDP